MKDYDLSKYFLLEMDKIMNEDYPEGEWHKFTFFNIENT